MPLKTSMPQLLTSSLHNDQKSNNSRGELERQCDKRSPWRSMTSFDYLSWSGKKKPRALKPSASADLLIMSDSKQDQKTQFFEHNHLEQLSSDGQNLCNVVPKTN